MSPGGVTAVEAGSELWLPSDPEVTGRNSRKGIKMLNRVAAATDRRRFYKQLAAIMLCILTTVVAITSLM